MSIRLVREEIRRFLESSKPEVICIKGKWGVGKTFTWDKYLKELKEKGVIALKNYSYVSLFGQNSVEELKYSIVENLESLSKAGWGKSLLSKGTKVYSHLPNIKGIKDALPDKGIFSSLIRNQIICIDDLDRAGDEISVKNVLGLVSFLKEQKKCKIVLLLNEEELGDDNKKEFRTHLEKVVDIEMGFTPTPSEAAEIGIEKSNSFSDRLSEICITLGITNIRVIRKIQRLAEELEKILKGHDKRILDSALTSLALFGWVFYQKDNSLPSIDFIKNFTFWTLDEKEKEEHKSWRNLIRSLNFTHVDDFDRVIFESVEKGYFDPEAIKGKIKQAEDKLILNDKNNSFHKAWEKYNYSLESNEEEVFNEMFTSFKENVQSISPSNADSAIRLFREFDRNKEANELVEYYMKSRGNENREFYDPRYAHFLNVQDSALSKAFKEKVASFKDKRTLKEILMHIAKSRGWNPEDVESLSEFSSDQYYKLFKEENGSDLAVLIDQSLKFGKYNPSDDKMKKVASLATEALKKIADESRINKVRVKNLGILDSEENNE